MEEIWKDIPDYEGLYQVSNYGNVKSLSREIGSAKRIYISKEKKLKGRKKTNGYLNVVLYKNTFKMEKSIHQLVAIVFLKHIPSGNILVVDHKDNNKLNNRLDNLQIVSTRENNSKDKKNGSSKYVGVYLHKKKYISQIHIDGKTIYLGYFVSELEAGIAYKKALIMFNNGDLPFIKTKKKSSQYKGVYKIGIKWKAQITINKKSKHLGVFDTELEAHNEYKKFKQQLV
jgi:hypothetical protein